VGDDSNWTQRAWTLLFEYEPVVQLDKFRCRGTIRLSGGKRIIVYLEKLRVDDADCCTTEFERLYLLRVQEIRWWLQRWYVYHRKEGR